MPITAKPEHFEDKARILLQDFARRLNVEPNPSEFVKTPDGRASYLPVSFVEMTLDEIFLGQWELTDITTQQIFNEVVGHGILTVYNPVTGKPLRRAGFGAVVITQDSGSKVQDFNITKKMNALDLTYPKLKAEILKNAASSLGKVFGRDFNRKQRDVFKPTLVKLGDDGFKALIDRVDKGDWVALTLARANFILDETQKAVLDGYKETPKQLN